MGATATFEIRPFTIEMVVTVYSKIAEQQMTRQNLQNELLHPARLLICPILIWSLNSGDFCKCLDTLLAQFS